MPASNERALAKIPQIAADGFIMDLEDAVAPENKPLARDMAVEAAARHRQDVACQHKELIIRINDRTTEWHMDDVQAVAKSKAHAMLVPKVERASDMQELIERAKAAGAPSDMEYWCMIETPLGVLNIAEIAASHESVGCLVVGTVDLANEVHSLPSAPGRWNMIYALNKIVICARAYQKTVLDGVYIDVNDEQGFMLECRQGRELGFDGKTLIHPKTVGPANMAFSPSAAEIEHAHEVVQAHLDATSQGDGVATLHGKLVEALHVKDALRVISLAKHIEAETASN